MQFRPTLALVVIASSLVGCYEDEGSVGSYHSGLGSSGLVISALYGGGGNSSATLKNDYVELFNRGTLPVITTGLSIQAAAANATDWMSNPPTVLGTLTVPAGGYLLVGEAAGAGGTDDLPTPVDVVGSIPMGATSGKVALVNGTTALGCGTTCANTASVIDFVGYGTTTANNYEGTGPVPSLSNTKAAFRAGGGCTDSDDNKVDFTTATATAALVRNSGSPHNLCTPAADDGGSSGGNDDGGGTIVDMAVPDLAGSEDLSVPQDLAAADMTVIHDLAMASDDGGAPPPPKGPVVISQIYGGGGNSGASFANDFVELFNRGSAAVAIGGWSVQYGSSANAFSRKADIPAGASIAPGHYFLVALGAGTSGGTALPTPDYAQDPASSGVVNMSATGGKVALVADGTLLTCGAAGNRCSSPWIMDLVGYGTSAADYEGMAASAPSGNVNAMFRAGGGCMDSDNNKSDFAVAAAAPRNSGSPGNDCSNVSVPDLAVAIDDMAAPPGSVDDLAVAPGGADLAHSPGGTDGGCSCAIGGAAQQSRGGTTGSLVLLLVASCAILRRRRAS